MRFRKKNNFDVSMSVVGKGLSNAATAYGSALTQSMTASALKQSRTAIAAAMKPKTGSRSSRGIFGRKSNGFMAGTAASSAQSTQRNMQYTQYRNRQGHGWAAEDANSIIDRLRLRKVDQVGRNNSLNGADRIVNGTAIQTKYCRTAHSTVEAAFGEDGMYRYKGMVLETPKDQYPECVKIMEEKIRQGKVPGVTDPSAAPRMVRRGKVTYEESNRITKTGNLDSVRFDIRCQAVTGGLAAAFTGIATFWRKRKEGSSDSEALKAAGKDAALSGSSAIALGICNQQLLRTSVGRRLAAAYNHVARKVVDTICRTRTGTKLVGTLASGAAGKPITGQAAKNVMVRGMRTNCVIGTVVFMFQTIPDVVRYSKGKINGKQLAMNMGTNSTAIAGGYAGASIGAALGTAVLPGAGTVVGGFLGGVAGGVAGSSAFRGICRAVRRRTGNVEPGAGHISLPDSYRSKDFSKCA